MKYLLLVISVLFFGGCANTNQPHLEKPNFVGIFPGPPKSYNKSVPLYKINYPAYDSKISYTVIIYGGEDRFKYKEISNFNNFNTTLVHVEPKELK